MTDLDLPRGSIDRWHDRAVFHFLTDEKDRARYVDRVLHAVARRRGAGARPSSS